MFNMHVLLFDNKKIKKYICVLSLIRPLPVVTTLVQKTKQQIAKNVLTLLVLRTK